MRAARSAQSVVPDTVVELSDVEVRIDGRTIIGPLDWTIRQGERWVLLGPNGCGKTTLLRVVSFMLHPSAGQVTVVGLTLGRVDLRQHRHRIGTISAAVGASLRGTLSAHEVVMTARRGALEPWWHTYTTDDVRAADEALARLGAGHLGHRTFETLSSGERQRVLLARALVTEPELLVLDEPAAGLDLGAREALLQDLGRLGLDHAAPPSILVTHHVEEIPSGVTHIALMRAGRFVAAGPIDTTFTAAALSECFDLELELTRSGDRWSARACAAPEPDAWPSKRALS